MRIIRAEAMGMCFGVRDALAAIERVPDPSTVTIWGDLVHNEVVLRRLAARGFAMTGETERGPVPASPTVLVTAHGLSRRERRRLERAGKRILDTTCPLVRRAHDAARRFAAEGRFVIVVGRPGHVEVEGLTGDLDRFAVVRGPEEARRFPARRLGVLFQTTTPPDVAARTFAALRRANPGADLARADTVCRPTRDRQAAVDRLLDRVDALVVVGGRHSNNTRALAARAAARGVPALHVRSAADLDPAWFAGRETVGLTAGTSTLAETVDEVHRALARCSQGDVRPDHETCQGRVTCDQPLALTEPCRVFRVRPRSRGHGARTSR